MIYFVRHGETDYNLNSIIQGQLDIPLNATGLKQAEELATKLKDYQIDKIISSPLVRASKTAELINKYHNVSLSYDDRLKEYYAGSKQGCKFESFDSKSKSSLIEVMYNPEKYGAEGCVAFYNRSVEFFKEIENAKENILLVAHGGIYRNLYRYIHNITDWKGEVPMIKNCEVATLDKPI
ncbi:MAG: histidine phosphatase family protein [Clostridia bacterium]|nr:histidine phosphatase family protein [Clostridia bacterium]